MGCAIETSAAMPRPLTTRKIFLMEAPEMEPQRSPSTVDIEEQKPLKVRQQEEKVKYFHKSKDFLTMSLETSICVKQALKALSYNPMLQDGCYQKLLTINNKCVHQKQNRIKNLQHREEKAEQELEKEILRESNKENIGSRIRKIEQLCNLRHRETAPVGQVGHPQKPSLGKHRSFKEKSH